MKKILVFITAFVLGVADVGAAVRDGNTTSRAGGSATTSAQKRVATTTKSDRTVTPRATVLGKPRTGAQTSETSRNTTDRPSANRNTKSVTARAATPDETTIETRTGAQYEACKTAYFTCMDQFCALKNDDYRRCSCSNRISSLAASRDVLTSAGEKLTVFTESLDTVGMTAAQATAMRTASDGENALTSDTSASKALLQAIMNSIRGGDTTVGGKYSDLNSINMSFSTSASFGSDNGQVIASYSGQNLYSAVYPQCRNAVREDCNNASLQRAVTAYLMAVEQDCNTVQTAIEQKQKELKSAIREGSAMLDLARVENRQKHNSDDITTCINNVESAILSEEVCGANYHKCLDNGEFIDISTGAPITGVARFYELENLLTFNTDIDATMQKLSKISRNKKFVMNFESRTKKFAKPALDKCTEIADDVWSEYLDKAMLDIYYAQKAKVAEIKQGCFDFVSNCYEASEASITAAMSQLIGDSDIVLQPDRIKLSSEMCKNYVESCDNMFKKDGEETGIIAQYVAAREQEDVLAACRAVVRQCFDKYGGDGYENFYNPYSGLFETGYALDWFTLYDYTGTQKTLKSPCARQLTEITACNAKNSDDEYTIIEKAFGGLDLVYAKENENQTYQITNNTNDFKYYGIMQNESNLSHRTVRSVGVASEVYNQIIDTLSTQCRNINGRFIAFQFLQNNVYSYDNYCTWIDSRNESSEHFHNVMQYYGIWSGENMCPRNYPASVDTQSWGICSCWANGGRRSQNGASATCVPYLPLSEAPGSVNTCSSSDTISGDENNTTTQWCIQKTVDSANRVCPGGFYSLKKDNDNDNYNCVDNQNEPPKEFFEIYVLPDK